MSLLGKFILTELLLAVIFAGLAEIFNEEVCGILSFISVISFFLTCFAWIWS